jgi:hypothetical protein
MAIGGPSHGGNGYVAPSSPNMGDSSSVNPRASFMGAGGNGGTPTTPGVNGGNTTPGPFLSPSHRNSSYSFMDHGGNTVGLDTTSAAIARGEVGANYSRYSTHNLAGLAAAAGISSSNSNNRLSQQFGNGNRDSSAYYNRQSMTGSVVGTPFTDDNQIREEMDNLPTTMYNGQGQQPNAANNGLASPGFPASRSRFSEYGLNDASSSESPSIRDSAVFDSSNRHDSMYIGKNMEDTSLLWNEKNVEADE